MVQISHCTFGHCARVATCYCTDLIGGYRCDEHAPQRDIQLPVGWDWPHVEEQRKKWDIAPNMVPIVSAGGAVAWGTAGSVRALRT